MSNKLYVRDENSLTERWLNEYLVNIAGTDNNYSSQRIWYTMILKQTNIRSTKYYWVEAKQKDLIYQVVTYI